MDAQAHLMSLGWAGPGHALDARPRGSGSYKQKGTRGLAYESSSSSGTRSNGGSSKEKQSRGLVRPLLVSQRKHRLGIGKRPHEPAAGNDWWLKGFERALGNIGRTGTPSDGEKAGTTTSGTSTPESRGSVASAQAYRGKHGGLYGFFVKGERMQGTIRDAERSSEQKTRRPKKRKSAEMAGEKADVEVQSLEAEELSSSAGSATAEFAEVEAYLRERDKNRRRPDPAAKSDALTQFALIGKFFEAGSGQHQAPRRAPREEPEDDPLPGHVRDQHRPTTPEPGTREERRERRRRRKDETDAQLAAGATFPNHHVPDDASAKALRKAERRRRKEEKRLSREGGLSSSPPFQVM